MWNPFRSKEPTPTPAEPFTHSVLVRIDPSQLENADLDLRSHLVHAIEASVPRGVLRENGYGFARTSDAMFITFATDDPSLVIRELTRLIETTEFLGNSLAQATVIGQGSVTAEMAEHIVVYPHALSGTLVAD